MPTEIKIPHRKYKNMCYADTYARRWSKKAKSGIWKRTLRDKNSYVNKYNNYKNFTQTLNYVVNLELPNKILDFGCGNSIMWDGLINKDNEKDFYGIDIAEGMIDDSKKAYPNSNFFVGDVFDIKKIIDSVNKFDAIVSRGVVMNHMGIDYFSKILDKLHPYLNTNGFLMFDYINKNFYLEHPKEDPPSFKLHDKNEMKDMISKTKFKSLEFKIFHEDERDSIILLK